MTNDNRKRNTILLDEQDTTGTAVLQKSIRKKIASVQFSRMNEFNPN